ncbi:hypothetical protein [Rhodocista pekingensis]|uniref:Uncharacterized protein n=1 Tax=Rhodocista pekingensis TaxID=201185 RepID=A0ABW2KYI1_9PROT
MARLRSLLALLVLSAIAAPALADEPGAVRGFEPIRRAPLPGERVGAALPGSLPPPLFESGRMGVAADPRDTGATDDRDAAVTFHAYGSPLRFGSSTTRTNDLLGSNWVPYEEGLQRPYYPYRLNGGLWYNQAWVRSLAPTQPGGLPSVRAPVEFWNFR